MANYNNFLELVKRYLGLTKNGIGIYRKIGEIHIVLTNLDTHYVVCGKKHIKY